MLAWSKKRTKRLSEKEASADIFDCICELNDEGKRVTKKAIKTVLRDANRGVRLENDPKYKDPQYVTPKKVKGNGGTAKLLNELEIKKLTLKLKTANFEMAEALKMVA